MNVYRLVSLDPICMYYQTGNMLNLSRFLRLFSRPQAGPRCNHDRYLGLNARSVHFRNFYVKRKNLGKSGKSALVLAGRKAAGFRI